MRPPLARNIEIKPYVASNASTVVTNSAAAAGGATGAAVSRTSVNDLGWQGGGDLKYSVTQNVTADVTIKTDFAQVEADEQQVNLTRFSLFFPEKREFFLENAHESYTWARGQGFTPDVVVAHPGDWEVWAAPGLSPPPGQTPRRQTLQLREHLVPPRAYMRAKYATWPEWLLPVAYAHRAVRGAPRWLRRRVL